MQTDQTLTSIEIESSSPVTKSIIWLHGLGADGSDFVPVVPELNLPSTAGIRFIFPHAPMMPVTINNGYEMRAWYDINSIMLDHKIDEEGMIKSISLVSQLIENEIARGIDSKNIILAGFSQGAVIALKAGLTYPKNLGGVIALSGYFPLAKETLAIVSNNNRFPIFLAHGTEDPIVPYALGKSAYLTLKEAGYDVAWHSYPIQHGVCATEIQDIGQWIQSRFREEN